MAGDGRAWVDGLSPGAVVLLQVPPGPGGGADVVHLLGQSLRPDTLFFRVEGGMADPRAVDLLSWARAEGHPVAVLTFAPKMHARTDRVEGPVGWYGPTSLVLQGERAHVWSVAEAP